MEIPEPLRKLVKNWDEARDTADGRRLASLYAEDAIIHRLRVSLWQDARQSRNTTGLPRLPP